MNKMLLFTAQALNHFNHYHCRSFLDFRIYIFPKRHRRYRRFRRYLFKVGVDVIDVIDVSHVIDVRNVIDVMHTAGVCTGRLRQIRVGEMVVVSYTAVCGVGVIITCMVSVNIERFTIILPINIYI